MKNYKLVSLLAFTMLLSINSCFSADGYVGMIIDKTSNNIPTIKTILPNSSAQKNGLYQGDRILKINNIDTKNLSIKEILSLLRGESGTTVNILVDNLGEEKEINLLRLAYINCGIIIKKDQNNDTLITNIYKNSNAHFSDLEIGDKIIAIDEQSTANLPEKNIKNLLYGFENSEKKINVIHNNEEKVIKITLKDYQITQEEALQILGDFEKQGYNIDYAIKNGMYDIVNAYIIAGTPITIDMFEYALAYKHYNIASLMAEQNIDMTRKNVINKKAITQNTISMLSIASSIATNFVPVIGVASPIIGSGANMMTNTSKESVNMYEDLQKIREESQYKENIFLFEAIDSSNINIINVYIKAKYNLPLALNYAMGSDNEYIAKILVKNGVDPNIPLSGVGRMHVSNISTGLGVENHTAFTYAIARNKIDLVKTMLENGANINTPLRSKFKDIKKPIDIAAKLKNYEMIELLRNYGAGL